MKDRLKPILDVTEWCNHSTWPLYDVTLYLSNAPEKRAVRRDEERISKSLFYNPEKHQWRIFS